MGDWSPGGVLNRNFQDTKNVNFATQSKRKCCNNSYPVQDWTKQAVFKTLQTACKFAFSRIPTKLHKISENYVIEGGEKEKIYGGDPVQDTKMCPGLEVTQTVSLLPCNPVLQLQCVE